MNIANTLDQTDPKIVEEARRFLWDHFPENKKEFKTFGVFNAFLAAAKAGHIKVYSSTPSMGGPINEINDQRLAALESEAEAKAFWDSIPLVREEFGKFRTFLAYSRAARAGLVSAYGFAGRRKKS